MTARRYALAAQALLLSLFMRTASAQSTPQAPPAPDAKAASETSRPAPDSQLDAAADATAEVASLGATEAEGAPLGMPLDLSAVGLSTEGDIEDKLQIYGFLSVSYINVLSADRQVLNQFLPKEGSFFVGDLNLYVSKQLSESWRTLVELRVTYAPNGKVLTDGTIENNSSYDMNNLGRSVSWGGVNIERAYLEYELHSLLTIRAGTFLTPYGIWNVDHGSPVVIPVFRPYILNEQLFPERQTGIDLFGKYSFGAYALSYHLTASNGRGFYDQFRDLDETKAFGGRLQLETPWLGGLRFGASVYHGRFVDRDSDYTRANPKTMDVDNVTPRGTRYDEISYAADLLYDAYGFRLQAEFVAHELSYLSGARAADGSGFRPDGYSMGGYVLAGYRFEQLWHVMPFVCFQHYTREESSQAAIFSALENYALGLNFRPIPTVALKLQFQQHWIPGGNAPVNDETLYSIATQASWVF
jgi:hypothetical protein